MKRILKTRTFNRWLRKTLLTDSALLKAIDEMEQGLVDADLGGDVYKKRGGVGVKFKTMLKKMGKYFLTVWKEK